MAETLTEIVQAALRAATGTTNDYYGDWHAYLTAQGIQEGQIDGRILAYGQIIDGTLNSASAAHNYFLLNGIGSTTETIDYKALYPISADIGTVYTGGSGTGGAVTSGAELGTALTSLSATGGTIVIDSTATISAYTITAAPSAQIMIRGVSSGSKGKLPFLSWVATSSPTGGITFKWCDFGDAATISGACFTLGDGTSKTYGTVKFQECSFYGATLDPNGAYSAGLTGINECNGFSFTSTTTMTNFELNGCSFSSLSTGMSRINATTSAVVFNNTFDLIYQDASGWGRAANTAGIPVKLYFNRYTRNLALPTDTGNPHADAFQLFPTSPVNQDWINSEFIGNIVFNYGSRGSYQGLFSGDMGSTYYLADSKIAGNLCVYDQSVVSQAHALNFEQAKNVYVFGNRCVNAKPSTNSATVRMAIGSVTSDGRNFCGYNINSGATPTVGNGVFSNQTQIPTINTAAYQTYMDWAAEPTSVAECITAARWKAGEYLRDYIDYDNCTLTVSLEPSYVPLQNIYNQATSTSVSSNNARLTGGKASVAVSITGGEYQISSDAAGSTVVTAWTSASGTMARGNYIKVRHTTSGSEVTTTSTVLTLGNTATTWQSTTLDTSVFDRAVFDGAATTYSKSAGAWASTSFPRWIMAFKFKPTAATGVQQIWADGPANSKLEWSPTFSTLQLSSSTVLKFGLGASTTNTENLMIVSIDFTQNDQTGVDAAAKAQINYNNGVKRVLNGVVLTGGTPTAFDTSNGTRTISLANISTTAMGFGSQSDGGGVEFTGEWEFMWMDGYTSSEDFPDITDPLIYNKFSAQLIGADGSGPTGRQPLIYYNSVPGATDGSEAGTWNATLGLANKGTMTTNHLMVRQGSLYT
jgi:hypothetical protein